jgi:RpiR family carbohydrate utilization transcriptional regulator
MMAKAGPATKKGGKAAEKRRDPPLENIVSIMKTVRGGVTPAIGKVIDYVIDHRQDVVRMSISELADKAEVSEATVTMFCKAVGAEGFQHIKIALAQDIVQPVQFIQEDLSRKDDMESVKKKIFNANIQALVDTLQTVKTSELVRARDFIMAADRILIFGIGSAAPIAEDLRYRLIRIGLPAYAEVESHQQAVMASMAGPKTTTVTISHSGATHETVTATRLAKASGAKTICVTNFGKSPIHKFADVILETMARETQFRTEAMTSRTAQLAIVDALVAGLALGAYDRSVKTIQQTADVLSVKRF